MTIEKSESSRCFGSFSHIKIRSVTLTNKFYFAPITNTETQTFDNSLEDFHSAGISGTIRENLQNSIDAKLPENDHPVKVSITMTSIKKERIPGIEEIEAHVSSLEGGNSYTKETIEHMQEAIICETVPVLIFEDSNTRGLSGADQLDKKTTYNTFAYKKGVHFEEEDTEIETIRGGSHGVGKIANNAASDLHLMYFSNCDEYGNQHIGGTTQLIEHTMKDSSYRSTGYFSNFNDCNQYVPYVNDEFDSIFEKSSRGLKIVIPFLKETHSEMTEMVQAVCDNFFLAILTEKLQVTISNNEETIEITKESIQKLIQEPSYYPNNLSNIEEINKVFTPLYIENYLKTDPIQITVSSNTEEYVFDLYFMYDESIKNGRVGIVRSMGMKIVDHKVPRYIRRPYNAVLIGGAKEDHYLKSLENESHTALSVDAFRDKKMKRDARQFLKNLNSEISKKIDEESERLNPSDGKIDTKDLFYEREITFKSRLDDLSEKVELSNGKHLRKKKAKEIRKGRKRGQGGEMKDPQREQVRKPRKLKPSSREEKVNATYLLPNEVVNRIVFADKELLQFNLKGIKGLDSIEKVNISFRVVDGEGKEYTDELNIKETYANIRNQQINKFYTFDEGTIFDVLVDENTIQLELKKQSNRSNALKFIYQLEVLQ